MLVGCLQLMCAHLQIIWVQDPRHLQLIWAENCDVCGSGPGCLWAATPIERFLSRELIWAISQREPFPGRYFYYDGFLFCDVIWLGDIIIKYAPNEVMREFLNFTELVVAELRKLPQPALH